MRRIALWLSWLLMFVVAFEDLWQAGVLGTRGRVVGLALAGCWALAAVSAGRIRRPAAIHLLMIGYMLWCAASVFWSLSPESSLEQTKTYVQLVLLALIVWDLYERPRDLHVALQAYVLGAWVCLAELFEVYLAGEVQRRFSVGVFNENTLSFTLAMGIPVAWYLTLAGARGAGLARGSLGSLLRLSNLAFIPAAALGVALTASRAGMVSVLIGCAYMALSFNRLGRGARLLMIAGGVAIAVYGVSLVPRDSLERLGGTSSVVSQGDWNGRLPIWKEALRTISERPLLGTGIHAFHVAAYQTGKAPHNIVLSVFAELGIVGFALFLGILLCAFRLAIGQPSGAAAFWLAMLAVWLLSALLHNFEDQKITWLLFGLLAVSARLAAPTAAERAKAPAVRRAAPGRAAPAT